MDIRLARLTSAMIQLYGGDARRIHHFLKVHDFAAAIGMIEGLDSKTQFTLEAAALVHDIGIHISEEKYGNCNGKNQEKEGPALAKAMLEGIDGFDEDIIKRICYLVGHHHTYTGIDGIDYQILIEADFLVNGYEDGLEDKEINSFVTKIFKTATGIYFAHDVYRSAF